jgi:hypothetical protein
LQAPQPCANARSSTSTSRVLVRAVESLRSQQLFGFQPVLLLDLDSRLAPVWQGQPLVLPQGVNSTLQQRLQRVTADCRQGGDCPAVLQGHLCCLDPPNVLDLLLQQAHDWTQACQQLFLTYCCQGCCI